MTINMYYKCKICGCVCNLKYQMGYLKKHPIRYKCMCGVSIRGMYEENSIISFENADKIDEELPKFVVYCSGEFFTVPPFTVETFEQTIAKVPPPFILATQLLEYENYRKEITHILYYREEKHRYVRAINELYAAENYKKIKEVIRDKFDSKEYIFPLNNEADYLRATTMINQIQFLNHDGINRTPKTVSILNTVFRNHVKESNAFLNFIKATSKLETWKKRIYNICDQIYDKINLLMPAVSVDFFKKVKKTDLDFFAITTSSFEEIKQLYVDLYELIGNLLVLAIGIDNILLRDNYNAIKMVDGLKVYNLDDVIKMRNKGNIIKLIDEYAPIEELLSNLLNSDIRNSIGHYSYVSNEIADSFGQKIEFADPNEKGQPEIRSLLQICVDIWQMYKSLGVFNEIIHYFEMQILALEGEFPSFMATPDVYPKLVKHVPKMKIYPNDQCPCGSGMKYKKCCGRN